jgi:hypothetical protein
MIATHDISTADVGRREGGKEEAKGGIRAGFPNSEGGLRGVRGRRLHMGGDIGQGCHAEKFNAFRSFL